MKKSFNIVLIGAGNLATHLGKALHQAGHNLVQIWSQHLPSAQALASQLSAQAIDRYEDLDHSADIYIISVKDRIIPEIAPLLSNIKGLVVHTSGATDINVFADKKSGFGVLYPVQTFTKTRQLVFEDIPIAFEASDEQTQETIETLVQSVSTHTLYLDSKQRLAVHVAAVWANNFSNHLYHIAQQILKQNDIDFSIIQPLIAETAQKVQTLSPLEAQTGPAFRNDLATMEEHLEFLHSNPQWAFLYHALSNSIQNLDE